MVARRGTGGGHQTYAGGQIPLVKGTKAEREEIEKHIEERFLEAIDAGDRPSTRLVKFVRGQ
jgi:nanoRNase/pAp phosphatase (c-di-AMP/oligoRNAs hydrolase)